jgi:hypothetical protein
VLFGAGFLLNRRMYFSTSSAGNGGSEGVLRVLTSMSPSRRRENMSFAAFGEMDRRRETSAVVSDFFELTVIQSPLNQIPRLRQPWNMLPEVTEICLRQLWHCQRFCEAKKRCLLLVHRGQIGLPCQRKNASVSQQSSSCDRNREIVTSKDLGRITTGLANNSRLQSAEFEFTTQNSLLNELPCCLAKYCHAKWAETRC